MELSTFKLGFPIKNMLLKKLPHRLISRVIIDLVGLIIHTYKSTICYTHTHHTHTPHLHNIKLYIAPLSIPSLWIILTIILSTTVYSHSLLLISTFCFSGAPNNCFIEIGNTMACFISCVFMFFFHVCPQEAD